MSNRWDDFYTYFYVRQIGLVKDLWECVIENVCESFFFSKIHPCKNFIRVCVCVCVWVCVCGCVCVIYDSQKEKHVKKNILIFILKLI